MNNENKELLEAVIKNRLEAVKTSNVDDEQTKIIFKEAMEAVSKQIELDKIEESYWEQQDKNKIEEDKIELEKSKMDINTNQYNQDLTVRQEEAKKERLLQIGIFLGGLIVGKIIDYALERSHVTRLCNFEKEYTFTTTPSRSIMSRLFKSKK